MVYSARSDSSAVIKNGFVNNYLSMPIFKYMCAYLCVCVCVVFVHARRMLVGFICMCCARVHGVFLCVLFNRSVIM